MDDATRDRLRAQVSATVAEQKVDLDDDSKIRLAELIEVLIGTHPRVLTVFAACIKERTQLAEALEATQKKVAALREAAQPFADRAANCVKLWVAAPNEQRAGLIHLTTLTLGDCRRLLAALESTPS